MSGHSVSKYEIPKETDRVQALQEITALAPNDVSAMCPLLPPKLHRLAEVRSRLGVSQEDIAERLAVSIPEVQRQENPETDLCLSQVYLWRNVLETSVGELIVEHEDIPCNPIRNRCQLVKVMKSACSIFEETKESGTRILAARLIADLTKLMPELAEVSAWPTIGRSREPKSPPQSVFSRFDSLIARQFEEE